MAERTKSDIYPCRVCKQTFSRACKLFQHMKLHTWEEENQLYGDIFTSPGNLWSNSVTNIAKSLPMTHSCSVCCKVYHHKGNLLRHLIAIHGMGINISSLKNNDNSTPKGLTDFKPDVNVTGERTELNLVEKVKSDKHECNICHQRLTHNSSLKNHMRKHTGERPYKCKQCNASFAYSQCLWNHRQKHTKRKRYQCDICNKRYFYYQSLWTHYRTHSKEKPYQCTLCGKEYLRVMNLYLHIRKDHLQSQDNVDNLAISLEKGNDKQRTELVRSYCYCKKSVMPFECQICKKRFRLKITLKKHMKSHVCKQRAQSPDTRVNTHVEEQHGHSRKSPRKIGHKVHSCHICKLEFRNYVCLLLHLEEHVTSPVKTVPYKKRSTHKKANAHWKPYRCNQCSKSYKHSSSLYKHIKKNHSSKEKSVMNSDHIYPREDVNQSVMGKQNQGNVEIKSSLPISLPGIINFEENSFGTDESHDLFSQVTSGRSNTEVKVMKNQSCMLQDKVSVTPEQLRKTKGNQHLLHKSYDCEKCGKAFRFMSWKVRHQKSSHKNAGVPWKLQRHTDMKEISQNSVILYKQGTVQNSEVKQTVQINEYKESAVDTKECKQAATEATVDKLGGVNASVFEQLTEHRDGSKQVTSTTSGEIEVKSFTIGVGQSDYTSRKKQAKLQQVVYQIQPVRNNREMGGKWKKVQQESVLSKKRRNEGRKLATLRPESVLSIKQDFQVVPSKSNNTQPKKFSPGGKKGRPRKYPLLCEYCGTTFVWQGDLKIHQLLRTCFLCGEEFSCGNMFCSHATTCSAFYSGRYKDNKEYRDIGVATDDEDQIENGENFNRCENDIYSPRVSHLPPIEERYSIPTSPNLVIDIGEFVDGKEANIYDSHLSDTLREGNLASQISEGGISYPLLDDPTNPMPSSSNIVSWDGMNIRTGRMDSKSVDVQKVGKNRSVKIPADANLRYMDGSGNIKEPMESARNVRQVSGNVNEGNNREHFMEDVKDTRKGDQTYHTHEVLMQEWTETLQTQGVASSVSVPSTVLGGAIKCVICSKEFFHINEYANHVLLHLN
ncbi:hypothetical protein Pmani_032589 [Petrolisthes manimaculis]|uniref:C2H2-type domain-containing protein n=1 Tax=Petrolisthes manimaculis TaxID=1843537 RepID=A0AAE1TRB2_9EUCA|nr:hypothetical protein Pmani_032589 [Petrolisthes manimaculis]